MKRKAKKKIPLPPRMTPDARRDFVLAWANGTVTTSMEVPKHILSSVFMPLVFGALADYRKADLSRIAFLWADRARDQTTGWAVNGFPTFLCCRIMLKADWDELRPEVEAELKRRKEFRP